MNCKGKTCDNELHGKQTVWCSDKCRIKYYVDKNRRDMKLRAVEYKGGKCQRCEWNENVAGLQFHHPDPTQKEFGVAQQGHTRSWEKIKKEVDKCFLLCANCHAVVHATNEHPYILLSVNQANQVTVNH